MPFTEVLKNRTEFDTVIIIHTCTAFLFVFMSPAIILGILVPYPISGAHAQCILHTRMRALGGCVASLSTLRARVKRLQSRGQELLWHDFT